MVSHHFEVENRGLLSGDNKKLVLFAIGQVSAGESVASPKPFLFL
jgi:hypothetical protein